jgi:hypothetical protein
MNFFGAASLAGRRCFPPDPSGCFGLALAALWVAPEDVPPELDGTLLPEVVGAGVAALWGLTAGAFAVLPELGSDVVGANRGAGVTVAGGSTDGFFPKTWAIVPLLTCLPFGSPAIAAPTAPPSSSRIAAELATARRSVIRPSPLSTIAPQERHAAWSSWSGRPHSLHANW